jgi:hypothetical protein
VKLDINLIEVHSHLCNNNGHPMHVALVDVSSLRLRNICKYRLSNNQSITLELKDAKNSLTNSKFCECQFCNLHHACKV